MVLIIAIITIQTRGQKLVKEQYKNNGAGLNFVLFFVQLF